MTAIEVFGLQLATRAGDVIAGCANDIPREVPLIEVELSGSRIDVLRDAKAPDRQLGAGYPVTSVEPAWPEKVRLLGTLKREEPPESGSSLGSCDRG
jgi:hypothetical protein